MAWIIGIAIFVLVVIGLVFIASFLKSLYVSNESADKAYREMQELEYNTSTTITSGSPVKNNK